MYSILKKELRGPLKFKEKLEDYIQELQATLKKEKNIDFTFDELGDLLLSACRCNDFNVLHLEKSKAFLEKESVSRWINEKLIPNTVTLNIDEADVVRLLVFCFEITYQMFSGGTKATVTQKGFRQRRRTFESILVDQFVGKLGEIVLRKFLQEKFSVNINLDWEISTQIEKYRNDIVNAKKKVSIKSSPTLAGIWAESGFRL